MSEKKSVAQKLREHLEGLSPEQFQREWAEIETMGLKGPRLKEALPNSLREVLTERKVPTTLPELFAPLMERCDFLLSGGASNFTVNDFKLLGKALSGEGCNIVVFSNGGGKLFTIWEMEPEDLRGFVTSESHQRYIYGYRIGTEDTVMRTFRLY